MKRLKVEIDRSLPFRDSMQIGNATLYLADTFDLLPRLPSVDMVVTDPPYSTYTHAQARSNKGAPTGDLRDKRAKSANITFDGWTEAQFGLFVTQCTMRSKGWVVMTCDHFHGPSTFMWGSFVRNGIWVKSNPMPQVSGDRPGQGHEMVLVHHGGVHKMKWNGGGRPATWRGPPVKGAVYPTQKPEWLAAAFISDFAVCTHREEFTILDPCMGSGTTGIEAIRAGYRFIGIEDDKGAYDIACQRIAGVTTRNLF